MRYWLPLLVIAMGYVPDQSTLPGKPTSSSTESSPLNYETHTVLTIYTSAVARHQPIPELSQPPPSSNLNAFLLGPPRPNHGSFKAARSLGSYTGTRKCNQVAQWELEGELDTYYCGATPPDRRNGHGSWATPGAGKAGPLTSSAVPSCASFPDSVALEK